jgi:hypothetical protein
MSSALRRAARRAEPQDTEVAAMRYSSKDALMEDIRTTHDAFCALLADIPAARRREPGVWGDGWNICDLVAHLAEWQRLFLDWHRQGQKEGAKLRGPAPGYKWSELPKLNRAIWAKHRRRSPASVRGDFDARYEEILGLVERLSPESLLTPGYFAWTGKYPLTTYLAPNTASHYRFAIKVIKRWQRGAPGSARPARRARPAGARRGARPPGPPRPRR